MSKKSSTFAAIYKHYVLYIYWDIIGWLLGDYWVVNPLVSEPQAYLKPTHT